MEGKATDKIYFFNEIPKTVREPGPVKVDRLCNTYEAINIDLGGTIAIVNGVPLSPPAAGQTIGDSITFGGWKGEILRGLIYVQFQGGATGNLLIKQKVYLPGTIDETIVNDLK